MMPAVKVVVSDLHLGDGDPAREHWGAAQQRAWERLLRETAPGAPTSGAPNVELIVDGDCFDLLTATPAPPDPDRADAATAVDKIDRILAMHGDWLAALRRFLVHPGRAVTFLIGNHDAELALPAVRARIYGALRAPAGRARFCLARAYRPLPDVEIEHGCQFDPWNRVPDLWDDPAATSAAPGDLEARPPAGGSPPAAAASMRPPFGSRYHYRVLAPIGRRFPYLDQLHPGLPQAGVLALLCLYAPDLVIDAAGRARALVAGGSDPAPAPAVAAALAEAAARGPAALFAAMLPGVAALEGQVQRDAGAPDNQAGETPGAAYAAALGAGLAAGELPALRAVFAAPAFGLADVPALDAATTASMLARAPGLRLALCGHTHVEGAQETRSPDGAPARVLNTGTWLARLALPAPEAIDAHMAAWLRDPGAGPSPLVSATAFTYAILRAAPGAPTACELRRADDPPAA